MADYKVHKARLEQAMRRLYAAEARSLEKRRLDELAGRTYVRDLDVNGLAAVIADLLREQKSELVQHCHRLFQLSMSKSARSDSNEDVRAKNLHARLCAVESAIRSLQRGKS